MKRVINKLGILVRIETEDPESLGYIQFGPAFDPTCTHTQTGKGGIKTIMSTIRDMMIASGLHRFYFETEGCPKRLRIYLRFLQRAGIEANPVPDEDGLWEFNINI